ncbi:MAG TPA: hypothetical protein VN457_06540, partial [Chlamydiales bacterium]|nr:hypothetical protein [Chlamydiales bacterium]
MTHGVTYEHVATDHPLSVHIVRIDPTKVTLSSVRALNDGIGRESLSSIVHRTGALVAINGGFFTEKGTFDGLPMGMLKINGQWLAETKKPRSAVGWSKESTQLFFDRIHLTTSCLFDDTIVLPVQGLNRKRHPREACLFTYPFHRCTLTPPHGTEIVIQNNQVKEI